MLARSVTVIVSARVSPLREREINELFCGGRTLRRPGSSRGRVLIICAELGVHSSAPLLYIFKLSTKSCHFLEISIKPLPRDLKPPGSTSPGVFMKDALVTMTTMTSVFVQVLVDSPVLLTICSDTV